MSELVLIVDDEPGILSSLSGVLNDEGFRTICSDNGESALELFRDEAPDVVFLDIWLPDRDGLEALQAMRELDPTAAVVMMSGHGTAATAAKAIKMGACDYVEKPLSYNQAVDAVRGAIRYRRSVEGDAQRLRALNIAEERLDTHFQLDPAPEIPLLREVETPQRTIARSTVFYGVGLHSGLPTGLAIQPLPPNSGIHFVTLASNTLIPAHIEAVADTDYATTLSRGGEQIKTVEHLLSALHAAGITNLLVKVHREIPVLDGSSLEFCRTLNEVGIVDQDARRKEIVIDRAYEVSVGDGKSLRIEPSDLFTVSYLLRYPPPVGEQFHEFALTSFADYEREIAPARTFGFVKDLQMMRELGLATGGRLDNCILVGEDDVINTDLRFDDEFVRHKILDIIGDLYLLGYPIRGRVTAQLTGHRNNIALLKAIQQLTT